MSATGRGGLDGGFSTVTISDGLPSWRFLWVCEAQPA